jgi:hypothetical protein
MKTRSPKKMRTRSFLTMLATAAAIFSSGGTALSDQPMHSAPVLKSISVPFGLLTRAGFGEVRMDSQDVTIPSFHPQTFSGLDVMTDAGAPCATWRISFQKGRAATDYALFADDTPTATAFTPTPSAGGQNLTKGDYVWNVSCRTADGISSNTVTLTYQGIANAVNYGANDPNFGATPSGFGDIAGARFLISVGTDAHLKRYIMPLGAAKNQVTVQPADVARMPYTTNVTTGNNSGNIRITGFVSAGTVTGGGNFVFGAASNSVSTTHDITVDHVKYYGSEAMIKGNTAFGGFAFQNCTTNCVIRDSYFEFVEAGTSLSDNVTVQRVDIRYVYGDCINIGSANHIRVYDVRCMAPMSRFRGNHTDTFQIADNATPNDVIIQRVAQLTGDGDDYAQGIYFGGSILGGGGSLKGYVDDGTAEHGPGNIFTRTAGSWGTGAQGATIVIPGHIAGADGVTMSCIPISCQTNGTPSTAKLNGLAPTNIGNSANPANMWGVGTQNFQMSGILAEVGSTHGFAQQGNNGASYMYDFSYTQVDANPRKINSFMGSIAPAPTGKHGVLTVTSAATTNLPEISTGYVTLSGRLNYPGCAFCFNGGIGSKITGSDFGPGTYDLPDNGSILGTVPPQSMQSSQAYFVGGAWGEQGNCNSPAQGGSLSIDRGWFQGGYFGLANCAGMFPSSNTIIGKKVFGYAPNGALSPADFASGMMPREYLNAHPVTSKSSADELLLRSCLSQKGKIGGKLDRGDGFWNSAFAGETNAANHTGGGDWIIFDGSKHVISTHVAGCEAAP